MGTRELAMNIMVMSIERKFEIVRHLQESTKSI